jgi:hypothetical protein
VADTFLAIVHGDGVWSIVSHDQSRASIEELRRKADERGCRLVRLPLPAIEGLKKGVLDLSQAEEVHDA